MLIGCLKQAVCKNGLTDFPASTPEVSSPRMAMGLLRECAWAAQLPPTLCDPVECGPPGSSVNGILQAGTLEWVAMSFSF